tara:strand:- start:1835 stop:2068 length:234 start_codon:yes stop_codon:yes gene_type:complete
MKALPIIAIVTFIVFSVEALLHYNMGRQKAEGTKIAGINDFMSDLKMPPPQELLKTLLVVGAFASVTEFTIAELKRK